MSCKGKHVVVPHTVGVPLPSAKRLRDLLESQVDREVHLKPTYPMSPNSRALTYAIFVDTHLMTRGMLMADLPAVLHLGGAAALVPVAVAEAALAEYSLPGLVEDRFLALLRTCGPLFAGPGDQIRLYQAMLPPHQPPADVRALGAAPGRRMDLEIDVHLYGTGRLTLVQGR